MRLWSIHPAYLDARGLVALWREGLLAQKVLRGATRGYKHHPQLARFRDTRNPVGAIATYLRCVANEAEKRGYRFDKTRIVNKSTRGKIAVTSGQVDYEFAHLLRKLKHRDPRLHRKIRAVGRIAVHPLFRKVRGPIAGWEVT